MKTYTQDEWDKYPSGYKGVWTTERTDWKEWPEIREKYMGKRTLLVGANGGTCLEVEGLSFEIQG